MRSDKIIQILRKYSRFVYQISIRSKLITVYNNGMSSKHSPAASPGCIPPFIEIDWEPLRRSRMITGYLSGQAPLLEWWSDVWLKLERSVGGWRALGEMDAPKRSRAQTNRAVCYLNVTYVTICFTSVVHTHAHFIF